MSFNVSNVFNRFRRRGLSAAEAVNQQKAGAVIGRKELSQMASQIRQEKLWYDEGIPHPFWQRLVLPLIETAKAEQELICQKQSPILRDADVRTDKGQQEIAAAQKKVAVAQNVIAILDELLEDIEAVKRRADALAEVERLESPVPTDVRGTPAPAAVPAGT